MGDETDDSALWEKDREAEEASRPQQQDRADYLFQDNTPDTPSGTLAGTTRPQGTTRPGKVPGSILDIVGGVRQQRRPDHRRRQPARRDAPRRQPRHR